MGKSPPTSLTYRRSRWLAGLSDATNLLFLVLFIPQLLQIKYGLTPLIRGLLLIPILTSLAALALAGRLYLSLFSLGALLFAWWCYYWNLLL